MAAASKNVGDFKYEFKYVITRKPEHAARMAVLYPLLQPKPHAKQAELLAMGSSLEGVWRQRIHEWGRVGWLYAKQQSTASRMRNCPPSFFRTATTTHVPCHRFGVCPWCYGRQVAHLYNTVVGNLSNSGEQLLLAKYQTRVDGKKSLVQTLARTQDTLSRLFCANLTYLTNPGGYYQVTAEPLDGDWLISSRMLALFPLDQLFDLIPESWKTKRWVRPTADDIVGAVSRAMRYPKGLIFGDAARAAEVLSVKSEIKLSNYLGVFRGTAAARQAAKASRLSKNQGKPKKEPREKKEPKELPVAAPVAEAPKPVKKLSQDMPSWFTGV